MNEIKKEMTVPFSSVGADDGQSNHMYDDSITDTEEKSNTLEELAKKLNRMSNPYVLNTVTMSELYDSVYTNQPHIIENLLYPGLYLFAGGSKIGKSFMMIQLAYHVSTGTPLWGYTCRQGTVLYLALEDNHRRLQARSYRMFGTESTDKLIFSVAAGKLNKDLNEQLNNFMYEHPDTKLVIIDTLQKIREENGDNYSYANDYQIMGKLKSFADSHEICVLIVHHTRKEKSEDIFDMISGTVGLFGAADGAFVMCKESRISNNATLEVSGRDQPDQRFKLTRNLKTLAWDMESAETDLWKEPPEPLLETVSAFLTESNPVWCGTSTRLVEELSVDIKPNTLTLKLNVNANRLLNEYNIRYENSRSHSGRRIKLELISTEA